MKVNVSLKNPAKVKFEWKNKKSLKDRFLDNVIPDQVTSCWLWKLRKDKDGYGKIKWQHIVRSAHRVSAHLYLGLKFEDSHILVCHHCDNPECVNPDHLYLGTVRNNFDDAVSRGSIKWYSDEKSPNHKLSKNDAQEIWDLKQNGAVTKDVALRFGVSRGSVENIVKGHTWPHLNRWRKYGEDRAND